MPDHRNILLISLQPDLSIVGFKRIHYYLLEHGYNPFMLHHPNFNPQRPRGLEALAAFVAKIDPLFIAFSLMSTELEASRFLSRELRERFPTVPILWGGIHPTIAPETCLPYADYVCVGEGEETILEFAEALRQGREVGAIANLAFLENGQLVRRPLRPLIQDLDALPIVDHITRNSYLQPDDGDGELRPLDRRLTIRAGRYQGKFYDMLTSVGCPFSCTYCCSSAISRLYGTKSIRRRSVENCIQELERAAHDNDFLQMVNFQDENFLSHSIDFFERFAQEYRRRVGLSFMIACIPIFVSEEKIRLLREAGLIWVRMGLQSGSDRVCKEVFKRASYQKHYLRAMEIFKNNGVSVYTDVILDNPFETEADQLETIAALTDAVKPYYLQLYSLSPYHGTDIRRRIMDECPDKLQDPVYKDYFQLQNTPLNMMTRLAPYLPRPLIRHLTRLYRQDPQSLRFRATITIAKLLGVVWFEPWNLFLVLKQSEGNSLLRVLRNLPAYIKITVVRYLTRFRPR